MKGYLKKILLTLILISLSLPLIFSTPKLRPKSEIEKILNKVRKEKNEKGYTFDVGYSKILKYHIKDICGYVPPEKFKNLKPSPYARKPMRKDLPSRWDWREHNGVTSVKMQGSCGGCWAFSTIGCVEALVKINDGVEMDLSEQNLISCDTAYNGCNGGLIALDFIQEYGAVYEECDPYQEQDTECNEDCPRPVYITEWHYVDDAYSVPSVDDIKNAIYNYGPVSAAVYADSNFQAYSGGVFNSCSDTSPNHAILLVGWDDSLGTNGCWILKNSWDTDWGDNGYMYIEYGCSNVGYSAEYAIYTSPTEPDLDYWNLSWSETSGGNGNNLPDPGETLDLNIQVVNNFGTDATNVNATLSTSDSYCTVNQNTSSYPDISRGHFQTNNTPFNVTFANDIPKGHKVNFILSVTCNGKYSKDISFSVVPNLGGIIIYDWDSSKNSGTVIRDTLESIGKDCIYETDKTYFDQLNKFDAVFVCLGVYNTNHVLTSEEGDTLKDYLDGGGNLYMEGGDTWYYDSQTSVHPYFGISSDSDGAGDLGTIIGESGTFGEGFTFSYNSDDTYNSYNDHIAPNTSEHPNAVLIFENQSPEYGCMVSNEENEYKTIGASLLFGGLQDSGENTKANLMKKILDFFGLMGAPGDVNGDGNVDINDVIELSNYLNGNISSLPTTGCGGDINNDGSIDAIDVAYLLNMVNGNL